MKAKGAIIAPVLTPVMMPKSGRVPASLYLEDYELLDPVDGPLAAAAQQADESAVSQLDTVFDLAAIREPRHRR